MRVLHFLGFTTDWIEDGGGVEGFTSEKLATMWSASGCYVQDISLYKLQSKQGTEEMCGLQLEEEWTKRLFSSL